MPANQTPPPRPRFPSPERRTRSDVIATGAIVACLIAGGAGVWFSSDAHSVQHHVADGQPQELATTSGEMPRTLRPLWTANTQSEELVVDREGVVKLEGTKVTMLNTQDGQQRWSYDKGEEVCGVTKGWDKTTMVFRGPKGCGQAISLDSLSGQYWATRDALAPESVKTFRSSDIIGTFAPKRVEAWRSDLVRTVEIGQPFTPVKVGKQEYVNCEFTSVGTAGSLLATIQTCPEETEGKKIVRLLNTTPADSDAPETWHTFRVPPGSEIVATSKDRVAITIPGKGKNARLQVLDKEGKFENFTAEVGPIVTDRAHRGDTTPFKPLIVRTEKMSGWFNGSALQAFNPETLKPMWSLSGALGPGVEVNGKLAVPMRDKGIAIVNQSTGKVERTIAVDREDYKGAVQLEYTGHNFVEQRGEKLVGLGSADK